MITSGNPKARAYSKFNSLGVARNPKEMALGFSIAMFESFIKENFTWSFFPSSKSIVLFKPNLMLMRCSELAEYSFAALFITFLYCFYFSLTYNCCFCIFMICFVLRWWPVSNAVVSFLLRPHAVNSWRNHVIERWSPTHSQEPTPQHSHVCAAVLCGRCRLRPLS